jgi:uncharacterized protein (TIGR02145 family)
MLEIPNSVKLYGGFSGTEASLEERQLSPNSTVIDAQNKFGSVVYLGISTELNGFTIQNGFANDNPQKNGGGVWADDNAIIANCIIVKNSAYANGGGVYAKGSVEFVNSNIRDNEARGSGCNVFANCLVLETDTVISGGGGGNAPVVPADPDCTLPTVTTHPIATAQSNRLGTAFTALSVVASGENLSYQWYSNTANSNMSGVAITNATGASYTPPSTAVGSKYYYCIITNSCGIARTNVSGSHSVQEAILANKCNTATPGFGESLGTVSFKSDKTWTIGNREWSDVVYAENCNKTSYNGGVSGNYNADCRSNSNRETYGDLFSWCTVNRFEAELCPGDWRVPTNQEFATLCGTLGLTSARTGTDQYGDYWQNANSIAVVNNLVNTWGSVYGGDCDGDGTLLNQGSYSYYWSLTESSADYGYYLTFSSAGFIRPQGMNSKYYGFTLRCVK